MRATVSLVHFPADDPVLTPQMEPTHAYLLVEGHVRREAGILPEATYGAGTLFGARALLSARATSTSVALDDVTAWQIPKATLQSLLSANPAFCAAVFGEIARRLSRDETRGEQRKFLSLMMARVRDAYVRKPFYVDAALDLVSVCALMAETGQCNALVRDGQRVGMFTTTDLRDALLRRAGGQGGYLPPQAVALRDGARFELVTVNADGELFEALLLMIRHRVHRVLVRDGAAIVGVLCQLDLMSFVSNHSHIIALQIEQAECVADLKAAALQMDGLVSLLHGGGVKVELISSMARVLNAQVFERLWSFVAPAELVRNSCLLVMGDEGRGEQILKTDQDNALLLRDGFVCEQLPAVAEAFVAALAEFGYPPCPDGNTLSNPLWRAPLAQFRERLRGWIHGTDPEGPRCLAVFADATAVAGDAGMLQQARQFMHDSLPDNRALLERRARAMSPPGRPKGEFRSAQHEGIPMSPPLGPAGWWARLAAHRGRDGPWVELKAQGTLPIVQAVRALALLARQKATGTAERLRLLVDAGQLDAALAAELLGALQVLWGQTLTSQLQQRQLGQPLDHLVRLSALSALQRDQLKAALDTAKRLRQPLRLRQATA